MTLGAKVRSLRAVEGELRGLGRPMTQQEIAGAIRRELGASLSQSYLSQIESGARPHLSNRSRITLARFFRVHPGYLVSDPPGFHTTLTSSLRVAEDQLDRWLSDGVEHFSGDVALQEALLGLARHEDSRKCLILLGAIVQTPKLVDRLLDALTPAASAAPPPGRTDEAWLQ
jgi:transcriptional regulator with XRE-family HTH domain